MTSISATILRNNLSDAIEEVQSKKDFLLIKTRGKITSALINIDFFEDLLAQTNHQYQTSIKQARDEYRQGQVFSHDEVFGEL